MKPRRRARNKRTAAVLPLGRVDRPAELGPGGLTVTMRSEDGETSVFDFADLPDSYDVPEPLLRTVAAAFAWACGPSGGWRSFSSAENGWSAVRRALKYTAAVHPEVTTIEALTPEVWWDCRDALLAVTKHGTQVKSLRKLLAHCDGLPNTTRLALRARMGKPGKRKYPAYRRGEFARILRLARRVFRFARRRIESNKMLLDRYRAGNEPDDCLRIRIAHTLWTIGAILDCISRTGRRPPGRITDSQRALLREALGVEPRTPFWTALFPTSDEVYAAMILFVCARGLNLSTLDRLKKSDGEVVWDPSVWRRIARVRIDKPRRGRHRYSAITLVGREALLWEQTVAMTDHARETLASLGHEEDSLFIACTRGRRSAHHTRNFMVKWKRGIANAMWNWHYRYGIEGNDGVPLRVSLRRLRLTELVINREPRQHSASVSAKVYVLPDPQTVEAARSVVLEGQAGALKDAGQRVIARLVTDDDLVPEKLAAMFNISEQRAREVAQKLPQRQLDTATVACADFEHSPHPFDAGGPCTADFLMCLVCPCGIVTKAHIPRLLALRRSLVTAATASASGAREDYYRRHVAAIDDALSQFPAAEVVEQADPAIPLEGEIMRLLNGNYNS